MNEDDVKNLKQRFEERSGAKVPPPRRTARASTQAPQEDARTAEKWHDVPEHAPRTLSHKATGRSPKGSAMTCVPSPLCGPK